MAGCRLAELYAFVESTEAALIKQHAQADQLARIGASKVAQRVRDGTVNGNAFDAEGFADMQRLVDYRIKQDKPPLDVFFGKPPEPALLHDEEGQAKVHQRIEFAVRFGYGNDVIFEEQKRLSSLDE